MSSPEVENYEARVGAAASAVMSMWRLYEPADRYMEGARAEIARMFGIAECDLIDACIAVVVADAEKRWNA